VRKILDKLYIKNWIIGIAKCDDQLVIENSKLPKDFHWIRHPDFNKFYADPFIYHGKDGALYLFCEELSRNNFIGTITCLKLDSEFNIIQKNVLLKSNLHYSYPFLIEYNSKLFVIPENSSSNKLIAYEFDEVNLSLINQIEILDTNLYDCTFLEHDSKFWLFGYKGNDKTMGELHIYYSSELFGKYVPHPSNPVKYALDGCRPAGKFIKVRDEIFRPSQNNMKKYGESISINIIVKLTETEFKEDFSFELNAKEFLNGFERLHTINFSNEYMVIDSTYSKFAPIMQLKRFFNKM
jgi:hypothetical protein